jgi:hypothetical protein
MRDKSQIIEAMYDGTVLHPDSTLDVEPNTHVRITVEAIPKPATGRKPFLDTARSLNLDGLADWSENYEERVHDNGNRAG